MSQQQQRPLYVPRAKRKQRFQERLHGAFTGGYSAGYFNTVGTAEGWTPTSSSAVVEEQRREDFMDENDHNEWGGPKAVRTEYHSSDTALPRLVGTSTGATNLGLRLLQIWGWKEGAFHENTTKESSTVQPMLERRLRKLRLQQQRFSLPKPKLDNAGLGFDPYADAPEFKKYKEQRLVLAAQRAQLQRKDVYRLNDVLGQDDDYPRTVQDSGAGPDDTYTSFETMEDFVGSKSTGGFALRDDDDDVYDNNRGQKVTKKIHLDTDAYDTIAYEYHSDEELSPRNDNRKEESKKPTAGENKEGGSGLLIEALSSWVSKAYQGTPTTVVTSDGRPPLAGFVMGTTQNGPHQRARGPDVPLDYEIQTHVFSPDEHPYVIQALGQAEKQSISENRKRSAVEEALACNATVYARNREVTGSELKGVRLAMSDRFTTATCSDNEAARADVSDTPSDNGRTGVSDAVRRRLTNVNRTVVLFSPDPLLCKRFHVPIPHHGEVVSGIDTSTSVRSGQLQVIDEIVKNAKNTAKQRFSKEMKSVLEEVSSDKALDTFDVMYRPSDEFYKSIYDHESDDGSSISDDRVIEHAEKETRFATSNTCKSEVHESHVLSSVDKDGKAADRNGRGRHSDVVDQVDGQVCRHSRSHSTSSIEESCVHRERHRKKEKRKYSKKKREKKSKKKRRVK